MPKTSTLATWLPIPEWEGWYEVSDTGLVRSVTRTLTLSDGRVRTFQGVVLSPSTGEYGHQSITLYRQDGGTGVYVHQLVMRAFVGPPPEGMEVCHNDGDATNNRRSNLRYDTSLENTLDNVRNGTHHYAKRDADKWGHLLLGPNLRQAKNQRVCLTCHNVRNQMSKARKAGRPVPDFKITADAYYAEIMRGYLGEHQIA